MSNTEQMINELAKAGKIIKDNIFLDNFVLTKEFENEIFDYIYYDTLQYAEIKANKYYEHIWPIINTKSEDEQILILKGFIDKKNIELLDNDFKLNGLYFYIKKRYNISDYYNFYKTGKLDTTKLKEYQDFRNEQKTIKLIEDIVKQISKSNNKELPTGFKSDFESKQIETLFELLIGEYIDKNTDIEHFKAIFRDEALPGNFIKIKWRKTNTLLSYFLKEIFHNNNYLDVWNKAENIFIKQNKKQFKNLRQSETNSPNPIGYEKLKIIFQTIYTHLQ